MTLRRPRLAAALAAAVAAGLAAGALGSASARAQSGAFAIDPADGSILVADPAGRERFTLYRPGAGGRAPLTFDALGADLLAVSPNANLLLFSERGDGLVLRDTEGRRVGGIFRPEIGDIAGAEFAPDGRAALVLSGHRHVAVLRIDAAAGANALAMTARFRAVANGVPRARFLPGTDAIAVGDGDDGAIRIFGRDGARRDAAPTMRADTDGNFYRLVVDPKGAWLGLHMVGDCSNWLTLVAVSPGGMRVAKRRTLEWCTHNYATGLALSPAGDRLAIAGIEGVRLFAPDGRRVATLAAPPTRGDEGEPDPLSARHLAYAPSGKVLVGWNARIVRAWGPDGKPLGAPFRPHEREIAAVRFAPARDLMVTADAAGAVRLWSVPGFKRVGEFAVGNAAVERLAVAADDTVIALASRRGELRRWSAALLPGAAIETGHEMPVGAVAFSPDGAHLVTMDRREGALRVQRRADGAAVGQPVRLDFRFTGRPAFSPRAPLVALPSGYGEFRIVNYLDPARSPKIPTERGRGGIFAAAFSPVEDVVYAGLREGALLFFRHDGAPARPRLDLGDESVTALAVSPNGETLAVGFGDGAVRLLARDGAAKGAAIKAHGGPVSAIAFARDGARFVTAGGDRDAGLIFVTRYEGEATARVWSAAGAAIGAPVRLPRGAAALAFAPDGRALVVEDRRGVVAVWGFDGEQRAVLWAE
jgi:WD40 repeat protein